MLGLHGQALGAVEGVRVGQRLGIGAYLKPTPTDILGAIYHSDWAANDPSISLSGSKVVSLPNRGLNGTALAQGTGAKQPTYGATSFNGGPGITFATASATDLRLNALAGYAAGSRLFIWCVFQDTGHNAYNFYGSDSGTAHTVFNFRGDGTHWITALVCADGVDSLTSTTVVDNNRRLMEWGTLSVATARQMLDGVAVNGLYTGALAYPLQELTLGAARTGSTNNDVVIARVIMANGEPTAAQRAAMRWYLRSQNFGIA